MKIFFVNKRFANIKLLLIHGNTVILLHNFLFTAHLMNIIWIIQKFKSRGNPYDSMDYIEAENHHENSKVRSHYIIKYRFNEYPQQKYLPSKRRRKGCKRRERPVYEMIAGEWWRVRILFMSIIHLLESCCEPLGYGYKKVVILDNRSQERKSGGFRKCFRRSDSVVSGPQFRANNDSFLIERRKSVLDLGSLLYIILLFLSIPLRERGINKHILKCINFTFSLQSRIIPTVLFYFVG